MISVGKLFRNLVIQLVGELVYNRYTIFPTKKPTIFHTIIPTILFLPFFNTNAFYSVNEKYLNLDYLGNGIIKRVELF